MLDYIIDFFSNITSGQRTALLVSGIAFFSLIESAVPLMSLKYNRWKHGAINVFFTLTTILVNFLLAFVLVKSSDWVVANGFGLLQWISLPTIFAMIVGLLVMDFIASWLVHWIEHHVTWMWKFHVVHHTDKHVDTTTANRHHPGESVFRFSFTILATFFVGAPMWMVFLYQSLSAIMTQFNHANIILPRWADKILVSFLCTPNMHHVHHHYRMPYSDTNYGNIFSFWDRIFGTYVKVNNEKLKYGVDTYFEEDKSSGIVSMLKIPFQKYRPKLKYDKEEVL